MGAAQDFCEYARPTGWYILGRVLKDKKMVEQDGQSLKLVAESGQDNRRISEVFDIFSTSLKDVFRESYNRNNARSTTYRIHCKYKSFPAD